MKDGNMLNYVLMCGSKLQIVDVRFSTSVTIRSIKFIPLQAWKGS